MRRAASALVPDDAASVAPVVAHQVEAPGKPNRFAASGRRRRPSLSDRIGTAVLLLLSLAVGYWGSVIVHGLVQPSYFVDGQAAVHGNGTKALDYIAVTEASIVSSALGRSPAAQERMRSQAEPRVCEDEAADVIRGMDAVIEHYRNNSAASQSVVKALFGSKYAFKLEPFGSRSLTRGWGRCPAMEASLGSPMDPRRKMLFLMGTQKGGTTFLYNALTQHPAFVGAEHAYGQGQGPWSKELHYFNRWPLPRHPKQAFLHCFPHTTWNVTRSHTAFTLIDGTPDYMFNAMAAPRIKAMWPNARFVVLLRDPVARAYSAWAMTKRVQCAQRAKDDPDKPCDFPSFGKAMLNELRALQRSGCAFDERGGWQPDTWGSCNACRVSFADETVCAKAGVPYKQPCSGPPFLTLAVSTYAPQLAWWFSHFPPERFKILKSEELHHGDKVQILNDVLAHAGVNATQFTEEHLEGIWGHEGGYTASDLGPCELKAVRMLRMFFGQAERDLERLLARTHPGFGFVPDEFVQ